MRKVLGHTYQCAGVGGGYLHVTMYIDTIKSNKDFIEIKIVLLTPNNPLLPFNVSHFTDFCPPFEVATNPNGASGIIQSIKPTVAAG